MSVMSVLKVHYFLWFGSLSCIMPYVPIFATAHSVANAEDVGILYFVLPFIVSVLKPLFCSIADRNNSHRKVLIISIIITICGYGLLLTMVIEAINMGTFSWYWFCILVLFANSGQGVVISLTDYLVMKEVTELNRNYGEYRVFGTIGWGGFGVIAGLINEYITQLPYLLPGLLLFICIEILDLICISFKLKSLETDNNSMIVENIVHKRQTLKTLITKPLVSIGITVKQIYRIFRNNPSLLQYIIIIFIFGALTAFHWTYYFMLIEKIRGKDPLLMGLAVFVQSFLGELPVFMISDRILRYCGPSMTFNISLSAFALRYFIYGYTFEVGTAYWNILLIEVVQGLTFSLFYTVMTDLAQYYATEENKRLQELTKTEEPDESRKIKAPVHNSFATMQGIMSGTFEGIGLGCGALIGGYLVERIDVFYIWKVGGFLAVFTILFNIIIDLIKHCVRK